MNEYDNVRNKKTEHLAMFGSCAAKHNTAATADFFNVFLVSLGG